MNSQLRHLVALQGLDDVLAELRRRRAEVPGKIEAERARLKAFEERARRTRCALEAEQKAQRAREGDIKEEEARLRSCRTKLNQVKTNREYQVLLAEIASLEQKVDALEEEVLLRMEEGEKLRAELEREEEELRRTRAEVEAACRKLEQERAELDAALKARREERKALAAPIEENWLRTYEELLELRKGRAVVPIREGICAGCNTHETLQRYQVIRLGEEIYTCAHCQRILYWEEERVEAPLAGPPSAQARWGPLAERS
ncbi:MAG: zinc ribbon domain-containing protein [Nitrospinota bacterium]